jgi:hypothetical protein
MLASPWLYMILCSVRAEHREVNRLQTSVPEV